MSSLGYDYAIEDGTGSEALAYHWHPNQSSDITAPHLHLEPGAQVGNADVAKAHLPTGRVSIEDVIELVVRDFHAKPLKTEVGQDTLRIAPGLRDVAYVALPRTNEIVKMSLCQSAQASFVALRPRLEIDVRRWERGRGLPTNAEDRFLAAIGR